MCSFVGRILKSDFLILWASMLSPNSNLGDSAPSFLMNHTSLHDTILVMFLRSFSGKKKVEEKSRLCLKVVGSAEYNFRIIGTFSMHLYFKAGQTYTCRFSFLV